MKAILVIDKPSNCIEDCIVNCSVFNAKGTPIPNDCPLRPLPRKLTEADISWGERRGYRGGWNNCLAEITGEKE